MKSTTKTDNPKGARREKQKAETRTEILISARSLFETKGFEKTTVREVAAKAGVGVGTIFSHFPDKESLLIASMIDDLDRQNQSAWETMPRDAPLKEKMLHLAVGGYTAWLTRPALSRVLIREMCFTTGRARDQLRALDDQAMKQVADLLEQSRLNGEIRIDADPVLISRIAFSVYLTTVLFRLDDSAPAVSGELLAEKLEPMIEETRRFLDQMFEGINPR